MTAKAKSGLNKAGIRLLADDLVAHKKMYDQDRFGRVSDCGAFACLAGMCLWRKIGGRKYRVKAKTWKKPFDGHDECQAAGCEQLGLKCMGSDDLPDIFKEIWNWPYDLKTEYKSNGPTWRVIAALKALQRLRPDGSIDPDPKAVHTRLPQLKALLATAKKRKAA